MVFAFGMVNKSSIIKKNTIDGIYEVTGVKHRSDTKFTDYWQFKDSLWHELTWLADGVEHKNENLKPKISGKWALNNDTLFITATSKRGVPFQSPIFHTFKLQCYKDSMILIGLDSASTNKGDVTSIRLVKR